MGIYGEAQTQRWAVNPPGPHSKLAGARRKFYPLGPGLASSPHPGAPPPHREPPGAEAGEGGDAQARPPSPGAGLSGVQRGFSQKCGLRAELKVPSLPLPQAGWQLFSTISQQVAVLWSYC